MGDQGSLSGDSRGNVGDQWGRVSSGETGTNNPLIEGVRGDPIRVMARIGFICPKPGDQKGAVCRKLDSAKRPLVSI